MPQFVSTARIARKLDVSPRTVRYWAASGLLPATRVGRAWKFVEAEVMASIAGPEHSGQLPLF